MREALYKKYDCFFQLHDEKVRKMYQILELHNSTYLTAFKDIYSDVEAGGFYVTVVSCCLCMRRVHKNACRACL